jgi:hypothetical protein
MFAVGGGGCGLKQGVVAGLSHFGLMLRVVTATA